MIRHNADSVMRELERRVLSGDLSLVPALALAYQRAGQQLEVWVVDFELHVPDWPYETEFSLYASQQGAETVAAAIMNELAEGGFYSDTIYKRIRTRLAKGEVESAVKWHNGYVPEHEFAGSSTSHFELRKWPVSP